MNKFNETKKIVLIFDQSNNFDSFSEKHGKEDRDVIINTRWFIGCAMASIEQSYKEGSPRRIEMEKLYNNLRKQLESQLTKDEIDNILNT